MRPGSALLALGLYFLALLLFQSRLTWENFNREFHITEAAQAPFTLGPAGPTLNILRPEAVAEGLVRGDRLLMLDGKPARGERSPQAAANQHRAGDAMLVTVEREGAPLTVSVRLSPVDAAPLTVTEWILFAFLGVLTPWFCLILGFGVAFQRPRDPLAWLLLLLLMSFGGVAQAGRVLIIVSNWELPTRPLAVLYYLTITNSWGFWMLLFGQYFPDRSAARAWHRGIRWVLGMPLACFALLWGLSNALAIENAGSMPFEVAVQRWSTIDLVAQVLGIAVFFASLFLKMGRAILPDARRRLRLLMSGAAVSLTPVILLALTALLTRRPLTAFLAFSPWLWIPSLLLLFLFPVTLAYVIVVAHAMEVNVVIRQGLQYALARGGARLLMASLIPAIAIYSARIAYEPGLARPRLLLLVVVLGGVVVFLRAISARLYQWIDRHFFREAVNTEHVLAGLSDKVRTIVETEPLLQTVTETISSALHVNRVAVLLRRDNEFVSAYALGVDADRTHVSFSAKSPVVERLGRERLPIRPDDASAQIVGEAADRTALQTLGAELLLPMSAHDRLLGFLSLGAKRSEAPYSSSDVRLLEAVAMQTGLALENSRLTAEMAREIAHRERIARELEIAREVQERLFPQEAPPVIGLDYAGKCRPAATIGGDYYDFLPLAGSRLAFAIGDVSGKGIPAALLMASLRASLHALAIAQSGDIAALMANLNQLIYDASASDRFASLWYGVFDPSTQSFQYVNAGHNPPILIRGVSGDIIRLQEGGLMLGGFRAARYQQGSVTLAPGDTVILFTDGVTEAMNPTGDDFGEKRLVAEVRGAAGLPAMQLLDRLLGALDAFTAGAPQYDDTTLVVVKVS